MSKDWLVRYSNNVYGNKIKDCYNGSYNIELINDELMINIYYNGKVVLTIPSFKNPYHLAKAILGVNNPLKVVNEIKEYISLGYIPGVDFTITEKGVNLRKVY